MAKTSQKPKTYYSMNGRTINKVTLNPTTPAKRQSNFPYWKVICILLTGVFFFVAIWYNYLVIVDSSKIARNTLVFIGYNIADSEVSHYLWTMLNSLMLGLMLFAIVPMKGNRSKWLTGILIVAIVVLSILQFSNMGLQLTIYSDYLSYNTYISNSEDGSEFLINNLTLFLTAYGLSFLLESEVD